MLLDHLFPKSSAKSFLSIFATPANMVEELLNSQIAYIKKSLASQTFYALELYQTLLHVQPDWEAITTELDFDPSVVRLVSETLNSLRNPCLRSFPEALVDIRVSPSSRKGETSSIADVTYRVSSDICGLKVWILSAVLLADCSLPLDTPCV
jgi:exocyst complex protein 7